MRTGTRLAALEMIESGTTTFADMYYFEEEIAKATREAGLRGVLGETIIQFPVADAKTPAEGLARAERFIKAFKDDSLIVPAVAPHALYTNDKATLVASPSSARRYDVPVLIHFAETEDEVRIAREQYQMTPTAYLESIGFWGPKTLAAHGVWVTDDDIAILKRRGVGVAHNPESNMKLASGAAPVTKYLAAGVALGLGTDGAASNNDPRHVRGDAPGVVPGEARHARSDRGAGADRARHGDDRRRAGARHGAPIGIARGGQARRPDHGVDERRAPDAALRSRCRTWSTSRAETTCGRRS